MLSLPLSLPLPLPIKQEKKNKSMNQPLQKWLSGKNQTFPKLYVSKDSYNDSSTKDIIDNLPNLLTYYDTELKNKDTFLKDSDVRFSKYISKYRYGDKIVDYSIHPATNHYHVDTIYRKLIDYCRVKNIKIFNQHVFNKELRIPFFNLCYDGRFSDEMEYPQPVNTNSVSKKSNVKLYNLNATKQNH